MVSNASDDLPDPDTPVITVNFSWGIESEMFLRLWTRAPWIRIKSSTGDSIIRLRSTASRDRAIPRPPDAGRIPGSWNLVTVRPAAGEVRFHCVAAICDCLFWGLAVRDATRQVGIFDQVSAAILFGE